MKRVIAGTAAVAVLAVGAGFAGSAIGQGTGGTVGAGAQGTLSVSFKFTKSKYAGGINPAVPRNKTRPVPADAQAGYADMLDASGKSIGRNHYYDFVTYPGPNPTKKYKGGAELIDTNMLDFGDDNLLFMTCRASEDNRNNPCAITGGIGRYAGARGTALIDSTNAVETKTTVTLKVNIAFIP